MRFDVAINPFAADVGEMVEFARAAEYAGADGIWVSDHFSGRVVAREWSRDPFVCLGAIAAVTERVRVGVLVANMMNRHVIQLASAVNSLQSLAPGRVVCGVGSGAAPGSRFAVEHDMISTPLGDVADRRAGLVDTIVSLREMWSGEDSHVALGSAPTTFSGAGGVLDGAEMPPVVVGASSWPTIEAALGHADGINLRRTAGLDGLLTRTAALRPRRFEVSVLTWLDDDLDGSTLDRWCDVGVDRIVLGVSPPHSPARLERLGSIRDLVDRTGRSAE